MELELATKNRLAKRKGYYLRWWDYLKLAHDQGKHDPKIQKNLKRSAKFYAAWDMDKKENFGTWWKEHAHLFEEKHVVRELKHGEKPLDPEAIVIEVPLRFSASVLAKHTREIIRIAASKRGINTKSKVSSSAEYSMTGGAEPKYRALREMLEVYRVRIQHKSLKRAKLLDAVHSHYANRKRARIPMTLETQGANKSSALRSLNRYIRKAEKIVWNVSKGKFPGLY